MRVLLASFLVLLLGPALAQAPSSLTVTWSAPTAYSDGKALPASDIWYYEVQWFGATSETWMPFDSDQTSALTYAVPLVCGSYSIEVRVVTTVTASEGFTVSPWAGPITYNTGHPCPPQPPSQVP